MTDTLIQKIQSSQRCIRRAREIYTKHQDDFANDFDAQDAAVLNLIRLCELCIDIGNFIIRRDKLGIPATSAAAFDLLHQAGRIDAETAKPMKAMVGFRNVAVHQYRDLDYDILIAIIENDLDNVIAFLDRIMEQES